MLSWLYQTQSKKGVPLDNRDNKLGFHKKETTDQNVALTSKCTQRRTQNLPDTCSDNQSYLWIAQQVTTICMRCLSALSDSMFTNQHCEEKFWLQSLLISESKSPQFQPQEIRLLESSISSFHIQTKNILDYLNKWGTNDISGSA